MTHFQSRRLWISEGRFVHTTNCIGQVHVEQKKIIVYLNTLAVRYLDNHNKYLFSLFIILRNFIIHIFVYLFNSIFLQSFFFFTESRSDSRLALVFPIRLHLYIVFYLLILFLVFLRYYHIHFHVIILYIIDLLLFVYTTTIDLHSPNFTSNN